MGPFSGAELLIIIVIALIVIGPENMPKAAAQFGRFVRQAKDFTTEAKDRVKEELGPDLNDLDLKSLDPRQYDPRRIVRDALRDDPPPVAAAPTALAPPVREAPGMPASPATPLAAATPVAMSPGAARRNPYQFTPGEPGAFDDEAT